MHSQTLRTAAVAMFDKFIHKVEMVSCTMSHCELHNPWKTVAQLAQKIVHIVCDIQ